MMFKYIKIITDLCMLAMSVVDTGNKLKNKQIIKYFIGFLKIRDIAIFLCGNKLNNTTVLNKQI